MTFSDSSDRDACAVAGINYADLRQKAGWLDDMTNGIWYESALAYRKNHADPPSPDEVVRIYEIITGQNEEELVLRDFARFCLAFAAQYPHGSLLQPTEEDDGIPAVAYLQNAWSDRAYQILTADFDRPAALYFPGFREVCEEVYAGRCRYAILPISSTADGQLNSFRKLITKYDLKIVRAADIEIDGDNVMRFSLLKKSFSSGNFRYLDLSVVLTDEIGCGSFLSAIESTGAVVLNVNTRSGEDVGGRNRLDIQLDLAHSSRLALELFLDGSHIRYETVGAYDIKT